MNSQELQDPQKVLAIQVKAINSIVNRMANTQSSMIDMKPKDETELDIVELDKS